MKLSKWSTILLSIFFIINIGNQKLYAGLNTYTIETQVNDEIDSAFRKEFKKIEAQLLIALKNNDFNAFSYLISPELSKTNQNDLKKFVTQCSALMTKSNFELKNVYYSTVKSTDQSPIVNIIPSLKDKRMLRIMNMPIIGKKSFDMFLTSTNSGWQQLLFVHFCKFDSQWKMTHINMSTNAINGLDVQSLYDLTIKAKTNNRLISSTVYAWALSKVVKPAKYLQYPDEKIYFDSIKSVYEELNQKMKFPFKIEDITIIGLRIETTNKEGLIPVINFVTDLKFDDPALKQQIQKQKSKILKAFFGVEQDFDFLLMRAYNEIPNDPKKTYNTYGIVLKLKE